MRCCICRCCGKDIFLFFSFFSFLFCCHKEDQGEIMQVSLFTCSFLLSGFCACCFGLLLKEGLICVIINAHKCKAYTAYAVKESVVIVIILMSSVVAALSAQLSLAGLLSAEHCHSQRSSKPTTLAKRRDPLRYATKEPRYAYDYFWGGRGFRVLLDGLIVSSEVSVQTAFLLLCNQMISSPLPASGSVHLCCHGVNLCSPQTSSDSLAGLGSGAGVRLPWQRLSQQRALSERGGRHYLPHSFSRHRSQPDNL